VLDCQMHRAERRMQSNLVAVVELEGKQKQRARLTGNVFNRQRRAALIPTHQC
jgi:hypothetical protein